MKKISWLVLLFIFTLFVSGCGKIEINNASIPLAFGADSKDDKAIITVQLANHNSPEKGTGDTPQFKVISASGKTLIEAARNTSLYLSSVPLWSHIQLSVLGENMAKNDITPVVDFLARDRYARKNNPLVLAHNASPEEILNVKPILEPYTATAIKNVIKIQETQLGIYTPTDTTELLQRLSSPGIEPVVPMITVSKNGADNQILLEGMAVFKGTRMVGSLNEMESRGYHLMEPSKIHQALFLVPSPLDEESWITLEMSRAQAKITPQIQGKEIKMRIEIIAEGNFYEQGGGGNLFTPEIFKLIEDAADQELAKQMAMCIRKAQSLNSDIFGWGQMIYRSDPEVWKVLEPEWNQIFPVISYELKVKFDLRRSYLTDKSFVFR